MTFEERELFIKKIQESGLKKSKVSEILGITPSYLSVILTGKVPGKYLTIRIQKWLKS